VYFGRWRKEALRFGEQHSAELRGRAVWLFDSGPTNTSADAGKNEPVAAADALAEAVGARGRTTFGGRFRREDAGPFTRRVVDKGNSPGLGFGDFRNFDRIRGWARQIASELTHGPGHPKADSYPVVAAPA
jgi:menaquinone-dependent protoporphyrinogen oxidase